MSAMPMADNRPPMADNRPPMVVGARQTKRAMRTVTD
jgi:hypothetical protein